MPPQRVQRMVQYSEPARPAMMRSTASRPLHSGQVDRAVVRVSGCDMAGTTPFDQAVGRGPQIRQVGCEAVHMTSLFAERPAAAGCSVRDHVVVGKPDGDHVVARLRERPYADLVEADLQIVLVDLDPKVTVVAVVIFGEDQVLHFHRFGSGVEVENVAAAERLLRRLALIGPHQRVDVVAAVATDDEGYVDLPVTEFHDARIALVVVGVTGEEGVRVDTDVVADLVDLTHHGGAAAMIAAAAVVL